MTLEPTAAEPDRDSIRDIYKPISMPKSITWS